MTMPATFREGGHLMRALVVYESMYGNTHLIANAIGRGLAEVPDIAIDVLPVGRATDDEIRRTDLLVVGGPTHAHAMSRASSRTTAAVEATKPDTDLTLDPDAEGEGLREWFDTLGHLSVPAAAFDTRFHMSAVLTGRASKGIDRRLRQRGGRMIASPMSFFVDKGNTLEPDQEARAAAWGRSLGAQVGRAETSPTSPTA
jgi:hypothetical protein